jgi:hypothetical protein
MGPGRLVRMMRLKLSNAGGINFRKVIAFWPHSLTMADISPSARPLHVAAYCSYAL